MDIYIFVNGGTWHKSLSHILNRFDSGALYFIREVWIILYRVWGTRAAVALMNGHFVKSFIYHPAMIYSVLLLMLFVCSDIINNVFKTKKRNYN